MRSVYNSSLYRKGECIQKKQLQAKELIGDYLLSVLTKIQEQMCYIKLEWEFIEENMLI